MPAFTSGPRKWVVLLLTLAVVSLVNAADDEKMESRSAEALSLSSSVDQSSTIVFAVLPDTQYYSQGAPYIFDSQTKWLANNSHEIGSPFILHLGDVVQSPSLEPEWVAGGESMAVLEIHGNNYSVAPGNHDLVNEDYDVHRNPDQELYLKYFSETRAAMQPTFGGRDPLGYSEFHTITKNGIEFLVLALDWRASVSTVAWAQDVLHQYSQTPVIVTSHEFLVDLPDGGVAITGYGRDVWDQLISLNDNVFMVICGHISASRYMIEKNRFGHDVFLMLVNFQSMHAGGNGYMRLIEFNLLNGTMEHMTFSPFVMELYEEKGEEALSPNDVVELTDPTNKYVVDFDFVARFQEMNARVPEEYGTGSSFLDSVRMQIAMIPPPPTDVWPQPSGPDDYPSINETLAHWRFDGNHSDGEPLTHTDLIEDLTGLGNDMIRSDVGDSSQADYLTWSNDHHPLSASAGSICFSNPDRSAGGFLDTVAGAPLSSEVFRQGFTIEAFAKLTPTWDNSNHQWTGIVSRANSGKDAGKTEGDNNEPLAVLGFSPSREAQFASFPDNMDGIVTAWSSPLEKDTWYHFAIVNDGQATRLYIDGYPARRDPVHNENINGIARASTSGATIGFITADKGWSIGSSTYDDRRKVFGGCIGEVRIVGRALTPSELLIAHKDSFTLPVALQGESARWS